MRKTVLLIVLLLTISGALIAGELKAPKNTRFISQCSDSSYMYMTVVDLSNNEIVILYYYGASKKLTLKDVVRTGMILEE